MTGFTYEYQTINDIEACTGYLLMANITIQRAIYSENGRLKLLKNIIKPDNQVGKLVNCTLADINPA